MYELMIRNANVSDPCLKTLSYMELSHFDIEIPMTAALDRQAIWRSYLILGENLFMFMWIK